MKQLAEYLSVGYGSVYFLSKVNGRVFSLTRMSKGVLWFSEWKLPGVEKIIYRGGDKEKVKLLIVNELQKEKEIT